MNENKNPNSALWLLKLLCFKDAESSITCVSIFGFVCCFAGYCEVA
jgi:hypothetical protein